MTTPSAEELETFRDFMKAKRPEHTFVPLQWSIARPTPSDVSLFCSRFIEARNDLLSTQDTLPFFKWLRTQPHYATAKARAFKVPKSEKVNGVEMIQLQPWLEAGITRSLDTKYSIEYLLSRTWNFYWWEEQISTYLHEYLYGPPASESYKLSSYAESLALDMEKLLKRYQSLAYEAQHVASSYPGSTSSAERMLSRIERIAYQARKFPIELPNECKHPIKRNDEHAKERLLVYRFWQAHRRSRHFPAAAVSDLTYLECVKNPYDQRSIEKMYASHTGSLATEIVK